MHPLFRGSKLRPLQKKIQQGVFTTSSQKCKKCTTIGTNFLCPSSVPRCSLSSSGLVTPNGHAARPYTKFIEGPNGVFVPTNNRHGHNVLQWHQTVHAALHEVHQGWSCHAVVCKDFSEKYLLRIGRVHVKILGHAQRRLSISNWASASCPLYESWQPEGLTLGLQLSAFITNCS